MDCGFAIPQEKEVRERKIYHLFNLLPGRHETVKLLGLAWRQQDCNKDSTNEAGHSYRWQYDRQQTDGTHMYFELLLEARDRVWI